MKSTLQAQECMRVCIHADTRTFAPFLSPLPSFWHLVYTFVKIISVPPKVIFSCKTSFMILPHRLVLPPLGCTALLESCSTLGLFQCCVCFLCAIHVCGRGMGYLRSRGQHPLSAYMEMCIFLPCLLRKSQQLQSYLEIAPKAHVKGLAFSLGVWRRWWEL